MGWSPDYLDGIDCPGAYDSLLVEQSVRDVICECLADCNIPCPELVCPTVCPPTILKQKGKNCCDRLDVWVQDARLTFDQGRCVPANSVLTVNVDMTRCAGSAAKGCGEGDDDGNTALGQALAADLHVLTQLVPQKLCGVSGSCGPLPVQALTYTKLCEPCLGWGVVLTIPQPRTAVPLGG